MPCSPNSIAAHLARRCPVLMRFAVLAVSTAFAHAAAGGADFTLPELRAALESQLQSIQSMHVKYTVSYHATSEGRERGPRENEWAQDRERRFWLSSPPVGAEGLRASVLTFDGERGYSLIWSPTGEPKAVLTVTETANRGLKRAFAPDLVLGLRLQLLPEPVTALLQLPGARLAPRDDGLSDAERKVEIDGFSSVTNAALHLSLSLDTEHDFLPRRIAIYRGGMPTNEWYMIWEVREFMRVRDGVANADRWFPRSATFTQVCGVHQLEVSEASVNVPIPVGKFRPEPSLGTTVIDDTARGEGRVYVVGGIRKADERVRRSADLAKQEIERASREAPTAPERSRSLDATPRRAYSASRIVFFVSLALALAGAALWFWPFRR